MTREEALKRVKGYLTDYISADCYGEVEEIMEALEQQPCDDCISRAKAIEEADKLCLETAYDNEKVIEMLNDLPSVGKDINVTTNEDAISRQAALNVVHRYFEHYLQLNDDICLDGLRSLPSVTLQKKTGHWIDITNKNGTVIALRCSCCENSPKRGISSDYCPNCGARMEASE